MNRRHFLKLLGVAPIAPSILVASSKKIVPKRLTEEQRQAAMELLGVDGAVGKGKSVIFVSTPTGYSHFYEMYCNAQNQAIGTAMIDIPKDKYGWVRLGPTE